MIIRKAKKSDIDEIIKIADQLRKAEAPLDKTKNIKLNSYLSEEYKKKELEYIASRKKIFLVAVIDEKIVGYVNGYVFENSDIYYKKPVAYLDCLCVDKSVRKQGIGESLIDEFTKMVKERGAKYIKLNAFENNIPAVSLYKKLGYEEYSVYYMKKI